MASIITNADHHVIELKIYYGQKKKVAVFLLTIPTLFFSAYPKVLKVIFGQVLLT